MTPITDLIAAARPVDGGFATFIPDGWKQGRTAYGGLSSALALHAAQRSEDDLPPLRSAQVSFVGPLSGEVTVVAKRLRRGRNAAFVQADVTSDAGLGLRATFVFMAPIPTRLHHDARAAAPLARPRSDAETSNGPAGFFTGNFDFVDHRDDLGPAEWMRWARLRQPGGIDPHVAVMAIADGLPPAAVRLAETPVPLSSMSWIVNFVAADPASDDGWYLLHAVTDHAADGFSSQRMRVWNAAGALVAEGMQGVAIFG